MAVTVRWKGAAMVAAVSAVSLLAAGCSSGSASTASGSSDTSGSASSGSADVLGTPNAASGDPVVFGTIAIGSGPVTFPEALQAEQAAVEYVNAYRGGIGGHPIKLVSCMSDGQPSGSQRCANQLADQKPVAILGSADVGTPGSIPVWTRENLAYLGGVPFTPVEQNYANSVIFSNVSTADNAAASVYAAQTLHAKSAAVIFTSDTQGSSTGKVIMSTMKNAGIETITPVSLPPTASDVSSAVATAMGAHPDVIYVDTPAACPNVLASLKQLGNTAKIMGIDTCTSPKAIAGANGGADGLYFAGPTLDASAGTADTKLYLAALQKYAPKDIALDSISAIGFQTVMDVQAALSKFAPADLTTDKILAAFRTGKPQANFMGHDYLCDGKQLAGATALCNAYQQIRQVKGDKVVVAAKDFVTPGPYYKP